MLPTFIIIGAMRAGTTSLARYLTRSDEVYMAPVKEIHFFDRHFDMGLPWYEAHFSPQARHKVIGEATPNYVHDDRALQRIASTLPGVQLVMLLRDPVDRAYSHYWHNRSRLKETLSFEDAIAAEPTRLARSVLDRATYSYVDRGRYLEQLRRVRALFPQDALKVFLHEDLRDDPRGTLTRVLKSIGADEQRVNWEEPFERFNAYVRFRSVQIRSLAKRMGGVRGRIIGRLNAVTSVSYPLMHPDTRQQLRSLFVEANLGIDQEFEVDTSVWD